MFLHLREPLSDKTLVDPYGYKQELRGDFVAGAIVMSLLASTGVFPLGASSRLHMLGSLEKHSHQYGARVKDAFTAAGCPLLLSPREWSVPRIRSQMLWCTIFLCWGSGCEGLDAGRSCASVDENNKGEGHDKLT